MSQLEQFSTILVETNHLSTEVIRVEVREPQPADHPNHNMETRAHAKLGLTPEQPMLVIERVCLKHISHGKQVPVAMAREYLDPDRFPHISTLQDVANKSLTEIFEGCGHRRLSRELHISPHNRPNLYEASLLRARYDYTPLRSATLVIEESITAIDSAVNVPFVLAVAEKSYYEGCELTLADLPIPDLPAQTLANAAAAQAGGDYTDTHSF